MKNQVIFLMILAGFLGSLPAAAAADPIDQATLSRMDAIQLQTEFGATIQQGRQAQDQYLKTQKRRTVTSFVPMVGIVGIGETAARANNLQAYRYKLLQLKRELKFRFPQAWGETKIKWHIDE